MAEVLAPGSQINYARITLNGMDQLLTDAIAAPVLSGGTIAAGSTLTNAGTILNSGLITGGSATNIAISGTGAIALSGAATVRQSPQDAISTAGSTQATGTQLTSQMTTLGTVTAGQGANLLASATGLEELVINKGSAVATVYVKQGATDTINGIAGTVGLGLLPDSLAILTSTKAGEWNAFSQGPKSTVYNTSTIATSGTLAAASIAGAYDLVSLDMTGSLANDATITLPSVASLLAVQPTPSARRSYVLRLLNSSAGAKNWVVGATTGYTLNGTMTVAQNAYRDFAVQFTTLGAVTIQNIGGGTV